MKSKIQFISAMLIFGSIGLFVKNIDIPSALLSLIRAMLGSLFLIGCCIISRKKFLVKTVKENLLLLIISSTAMAFNWILLFESYKYTTVSIATLSYYCAPVFVILLSPVVLKEKFSLRSLLCVFAAIVGMVLIMGSGAGEDIKGSHLIGIFCGLGAAVLYATVIITNKFFKNMSGVEATLLQLIIAAAVLFPYTMASGSYSISDIDIKSVIYIIILGIFHTGFAYYLYFSSVKTMPAQSIAMLSYIDPISAVLFSAVILSENMSIPQIFGGILILGSTLYGNIKNKVKAESVS